MRAASASANMRMPVPTRQQRRSDVIDAVPAALDALVEASRTGAPAAMRPNGTLTQNTIGQIVCAARNAPTIGPITAAPTKTLDT